MARQKKTKDNGSSLGFEEKLWLNAIVRPLLERATVNDRESVQLAAVRDALLRSCSPAK